MPRTPKTNDDDNIVAAFSKKPTAAAEWWYNFKAKNALTQYDVFKREEKNKSGGKYKNIHLSRLKVIGQNLFTLGLINIKYRIDQDRSRSSKKSGSPRQFATNHQSDLSDLIDKLKGVVTTHKIGYEGFVNDLAYQLKEDFGFGNPTVRQIDPKYEQEFFDLLTNQKAEGIFRSMMKHV